MTPDQHADDVAEWDGILKYLCWACPLRIEGPYVYVLPLVDAHQAEHNDG